MPPPTPPPPPPTQPVLVNFPPELVDKFAPHGLTGPAATLIAALVAIGAAVIAFIAVNRQITANASAVSAQIAADRSERRRAERLDLAAAAAAVVDELAQIAVAYECYSGKSGAPPSPNDQQSQKEKFHGLELARIFRGNVVFGGV